MCVWGGGYVGTYFPCVNTLFKMCGGLLLGPVLYCGSWCKEYIHCVWDLCWDHFCDVALDVKTLLCVGVLCWGLVLFCCGY